MLATLLIIPTSALAIGTVDVYPLVNNTYSIGNLTHQYKNITASGYLVNAKVNCAQIYGATSNLCTIIPVANTTADVITAVNNSEAFNITAFRCYYINNATERTLLTNTYNDSYDSQLGHNTTAEIRTAQTINTSLEVNAALNSSFYTLNRPWAAGLLYVGNISGITTYNVSYDSQLGHNTSAEINAAINSTFTSQLGKNTSAEVNAALNSSFYTLNRPWIGTLYAGNVTGITTYNSSYDSQLGHNTSAEINAALNSSFYTLNRQWLGTLYVGNVTGITTYNSSYDAQLGHNTTNEIFAAVNNNTFSKNTYNASYDSQLGKNTSAEINAALNSTFTSQLGKNTTAEIRAAQTINSTTEVRTAIYSTTMNLSNITTPADCSANNYLYGFDSNGIFKCRADQTGSAAGTNYWGVDGNFWMWPNISSGGYTSVNATNFNATGWLNASQLCINGVCSTAWLFNTTAEVRSAQTVNTSAEVNAALNSTFTGMLGHNTTNEIFAAVNNNTFVKNTYNASYDAQLGKNTSAEINAALNSTFTGQLGKNTSAEINAALNSTFTGQLGHNTSAEINAALNSSFFTLNRPWAAGTLAWGNLSAWNLNVLWTGLLDAGNLTGTVHNDQLHNTVYRINATYLLTAQNLTTGTINATHLVTNLGLRWGNLTTYNLDTSWLGTLGGRNITNGTFTNQSLASDFTLRWNNITNRDLNIPWLNGLGAENITTGTLRDSLLNGAVYQINGTTRLTQGNLSSTFAVLNTNVTYVSDLDTNLKNITGTRNITFVNDADVVSASIYFNGTHLRIRG